MSDALVVAAGREKWTSVDKYHIFTERSNVLGNLKAQRRCHKVQSDLEFNKWKMICGFILYH